MCIVYINNIKTLSDTNMQINVYVSIVGQAHASTSFLILPDILNGLIYYQ